MTRTLILGHHVKAGETFRTMLYSDGLPAGMHHVTNGTICEFGAGSKMFAESDEGNVWHLVVKAPKAVEPEVPAVESEPAE